MAFVPKAPNIITVGESVADILNYKERLLDAERMKATKEQVIEEMLSNPVSVLKTLKLSLYEFLKVFWNEVTEDEFKDNWHIKYLCDELQKLAERVAENKPKLYDLVINIPPGTSKTTITSIMFPIWCWTRWYHFKFITASHNSALSLESAEKSRNIINSDKFKMLYPDLIVNEDKQVKGNYQIVKKEYINPERARLYKGGTRVSTSIGAGITGFHAHIIIVDDPIDPKGVTSDTKILEANKYMDETLSMRKVDKDITPTVLIMQRLHENDPTGHILEKEGKKVKHICLPAEIIDYKEMVQPPELAKYYVNNLLDPKRLSLETLKQIEVDLGEDGYAGQMGQSPTPPGGGLFKTDHFQIVQTLPSDVHIINTVRYWDKAATKNAGKRSAGVKMIRLKNNVCIIVDVKKGQWAVEERERIIRKTAEADGGNVQIWIEMEPGSGGKESAEATIRNLIGFVCDSDRPQDDKETRAKPYAAQVNIGNVWLLQGDWNKNFIEEHGKFPNGKFKDQVDAAAGAFNKLAAKKIARMLT